MSPFVILPLNGPSFDNLILSTNPIDWWKLDDASPASAPFNTVDNSRLAVEYYGSPANIVYRRSGAHPNSQYAMYNNTYPYRDATRNYGVNFLPNSVTGTERRFPNTGTSVAFWYLDPGWWSAPDPWPGMFTASNGNLIETINSDGFSYYWDRTAQTNGSPSTFNITFKWRGLFRGTGLSTVQNVWRHFVFVRENNGDFSYYQNGSHTLTDSNSQVKAATDVTARDLTTDWRRFGRGLGSGSAQYHLDDLMIWDKALTGPQVTQIYNWMTA